MNVLVITLDQLRGDALSCAGHRLVRTPNLDRLADDGVRFARHYSQAAPCAPGRACLYTGTYQMNNRVVGNGTPLDDRFDNIARAGRRAGYTPVLFGYTDVGIDPRVASGPDDPRLSTYEGVLPGFDVELSLRSDAGPWLTWLSEHGHDWPDATDAIDATDAALASEPDRPAELSLAAFAVDRFIGWLDRQTSPWFAHLSLLRPHPPYAAAGHWAQAYDPADVDLPIPPGEDLHPLHRIALAVPAAAAPTDQGAMRHLRSQYYGMVSHVDDELGRLWRALDRLEVWDDTFIILTSDHGEQLGDQGLVEKLGFFEQSYHIPAIIHDPRNRGSHGTVIDAFTENVDMLPTLCEAMQLPVPAQCDGLPLTPFLSGETPVSWRTAAHWEWDWRILQPDQVARAAHAWPWNQDFARQGLAVVRTADAAYVQFGDGSWRSFDLAADPTWHTPCEDTDAILGLAQQMLVWRAEPTDRTLTGFVLTDGGVGRWPTSQEE